MQFNFDLISDLHAETWQSFDWTDQPTAPYCIVAGDVAQDQVQVAETLYHLGQCYKGGVFYIDGNDEHKRQYDDIGQSYRDLDRIIKQIDNIVYLQDNVVIINGVAIVGTNGWWSYDFDPELDYDQSQDWYRERQQVSQITVDSITGLAFNDVNYLRNCVAKLQYHQDVKKIVMVTHTVPDPDLVKHDPDLADTWRFNVLGNRHMRLVLNEDTENKIHTWCFGHYHKSVDRDINGIRYVNNCRGRGNTDWKQSVYYPKRITIEF